ncbi:MAG: carboxypeptidase-like regulatory domain-containing protein [Longimicrobiales bacterium]
MVLLLGISQKAPGQLIRGHLIDDRSDLPVADATLSLFARSGARLSVQKTDSLGTFQFRLRDAGSYTISASRIGYRDQTAGPITVSASEVVEVEMRISSVPVRLDSLVVTARRPLPRGRVAEFYDRVEWGRKANAGQFVTRAQFDSLSLPNVTDYMQRLARVPIVGFGTGATVPPRAGTERCVLALLLDGQRITGAINGLVSPITVEGVEIYRSNADVPIEYRRSGYCGAVLLWTRQGQVATAKHAVAATVAGRVLEETTGMPVSGADVRLVRVDGAERGQAVTDRAGSFRLATAEAARLAIRVRHVGFVIYQSQPLQLEQGRELQVTIRLGRQVIPLEPLVVISRGASSTRLAGFRERRVTEVHGKFVSREEIDRRPTAEVSDFFRMMSGVFVLPVKRNANPDGMTTYLVMMRGSGNTAAPAGADSQAAGHCAPSIFLDGTAIQQNTSFPLDDLIRSNTLEGIEVYTSFTGVPAEFQTSNTCGTILLWTREASGVGKRSWIRMTVGLAGLSLIVLLLK